MDNDIPTQEGITLRVLLSRLLNCQPMRVSKKYSGEAWATHGKRPYTPARYEAVPSQPVWKSKFYDAFVLNHIVVLHAIDATPARWHGDADSSPLDGTSAATPSLRNDLVKNCRVHLTHWLIST